MNMSLVLSPSKMFSVVEARELGGKRKKAVANEHNDFLRFPPPICAVFLHGPMYVERRMSIGRKAYHAYLQRLLVARKILAL